MKRYLVLVALGAILLLALSDAIWPSPPPLLIDDRSTNPAAPAAWPTNASAPVDPRAIAAESQTLIKPPPDPIGRAKFKAEDPAIVDGLAFVNKTVNQVIRPVPDEQHYGIVDKWVSWPADLQGDCEDVAVSKLVTLSDAGMPVVEFTRLRFVYATGGDGQLYAHAILEARMPKGAIAILDVNFDELMTRRELEAAGYKFFDW